MKKTLKEIAEYVGGRVVGDETIVISGLDNIEGAGEHELTFAVEAHILLFLEAGQRGDVADMGVLGNLEILHDGSGGYDAVVEMVYAKSLERLGGKMAQELLSGSLLGKHPVVELEVAAQVVVQLVLPFLGLDVALRQPLIQEGLDQFGMQLQDVGHQVLEVNNLGAVVTQDLRKRVMLLLSNFQEGNIIKQQLWETVRGPFGFWGITPRRRPPVLPPAQTPASRRSWGR